MDDRIAGACHELEIHSYQLDKQKPTSALVMNYRFLFGRLFTEKGREWGRGTEAGTRKHTEGEGRKRG